MTRDANGLAQDWERQQRAVETEESTSRLSPVGHLVGFHRMNAEDPIADQVHCRIGVKESGVIVAYDLDMNATIYYPGPGYMFYFEPDREGE